jgi:uncharacterized protein (TIGR02646 family)
MIFLDRTTLSVPNDWQKQAHKKLPDTKEYAQKALEFEALPINDPRRRRGFTQYAPEVLPKGRGKGRGKEKPDFPAVWRSDKSVKKAFNTWSNSKCAYCESGMPESGSQQVEHFKPKALFPSLAYDWSNYFLACFGCNNAKSDKWPHMGEYMRPDQGQPETLFIFDDCGGMRAQEAESDAQRTVDDFGLDRSGLRRFRRIALSLFLDTLHDLIKENSSIETTRQLAQGLVKRVEDPTVPYSQAMGQNLRRAWHAHFPDVSLF